MKILVDRKYKKSTYTISNLYVDGEWICNTIEDKDWGWNQKTPISDIKTIKTKFKSQTAIPSGTYDVTLNVVSPKYKNNAFYNENANGSRLPRILNVPGFDGILIHKGNTEKDSAGCLIVGLNTIKGGVTQSADCFKKLYKKLQTAKDKIQITIL